MKPRRDSGAVRVSPIMSEVRMGWAVMFPPALSGFVFSRPGLLKANHAAAREEGGELHRKKNKAAGVV
jgi:hypothetical protein